MPTLEEMEKKGMLYEYDPDIIRLKTAMDCNVSSEDLEESYLNKQKHGGLYSFYVPGAMSLGHFYRKLFSFTKLFIKVAGNKTLKGIEWVIKFSENVDTSALEDMGMDYSDLENMGEEKKTTRKRHYNKRQKKQPRKNQKKHRVNATTTRRRATPPRHEETIFDRIERMGS